MIYRLPTLEDKLILKEFLSEYYMNHEFQVVFGQDLLETDFFFWIEMIQNNFEKGNLEFGKSILYLCFDETLVGILVGCLKTTTASVSLLKKCGGKLESETSTSLYYQICCEKEVRDCI